MRYWEIFWTVAALIAGTSFAFVTVVVTLKGGRDLRNMFTRLLEQKRDEESGIERGRRHPE
jgi:hypothetical protein